MDRHAERIRRIQELSAQLTQSMEEFQRLQQMLEDLHRESGALIDALRSDGAIARRSVRLKRR